MSAFTRLVLAACVLVSVIASPVLAAGGSLRGKVTDSSGAPLAKVEVTLTGTDSDFEKTATSNKKGEFTLAVPDAARNYTIRFEKDGYATFEQPFDMASGQTIGGEWVLATEAEAAAASGQLQQLEAKDKATKAYNRGVDAYNGGNVDDAIAAIREAVEADPQLELGHATLGRILLEAKRWEEARAAAEAFLAVSPEQPLALQTLYDSYWEAGDKTKAEEVLKRLLAVDTGSAVAARIFNQAVAATKLGDYDAAAEGFAKAHELDPELHQALLPLAQIHFAKGEWQPAIEKAEAYLAKDKEHPRAHVVRYLGYRELGNTEAADRAFAELQKYSPEGAAEMFLRDGINDFNDGKIPESIQNVETSIRLDPTNPMAHHQLGLCYSSAGENSKARAAFEKFLELAPDHPEAATVKEMLAYLK